MLEKTKVTSLDIIVEVIDGKPYYSLKYKELGNNYYNIGYSSYSLENVIKWRNEYFELIQGNEDCDWIPVAERLPDKPQENEMFDNQLLELYLVSIKDGIYPSRAFWNGEFFTDGWGKCNVVAWMPLPEPYKED